MISVICVIVKNEQRYIREWCEYNLSIGFDKIYIYEDFGSDSHRELLQSLIDENKVVLIPLSHEDIPVSKGNCLKGIQSQLQLFRYFLSECKDGHIKADWIGFFDPDEFLIFDKEYSLEKIEKEYDSLGGVMPVWLMYGANGHFERPKGKIIEEYTSHMPQNFEFEKPRWNHKCLVNVKNCFKVLDVHNFDGCVFTNNTKTYSPNDCFVKCHLNHYYTKSWEDYCERMERRGNMMNNNRSYDDFFRCSPEFENRRMEMLNERRFNSKNVDTMYISKREKIIGGGNVNRLKQLKDGLR